MRTRLTMMLLAWLMAIGPASALTNNSATIKWDKTSDARIRTEIRWKNWTVMDWQSVVTDLDSTLGIYQQTFAPLPDSTGDRFACWDVRHYIMVGGIKYASDWISMKNQQPCTQMPLGGTTTTETPPAPTPVPAPQTGLVITSATPLEIVITASSVDCPRITTSTKGSTALQPKRTVTCVK